MKKTLLIFLLFYMVLPAFSQELPKEINHAFEKGDAAILATFFHYNVEINILKKSYLTSSKQAEQILKKFFKDYPPKSFSINFDGTRKGTKYGLGSLVTEKKSFRVNIYFMEGKSKKTIYFLSIDKE